MAEKIIAELNGKTSRFALSKNEEALTSVTDMPSSIADEAVEILKQLQYSQFEAKQLTQRVIKANPTIKKVEDLIELIFRSSRTDGAKQ